MGGGGHGRRRSRREGRILARDTIASRVARVSRTVLALATVLLGIHIAGKGDRAEKKQDYGLEVRPKGDRKWPNGCLLCLI
jgi:hypothetical protein